MGCEDQVHFEEGREVGPSNGDDIMVEVLGSHVYVDGICTTDGGDGGVVGADSNDESVHGRDESGEVGLEGNLRSLDSEGDAAGYLGSRSEVSGGEAMAQDEVNGSGVEGSGAPDSSAGGEAGENVEHSRGMDEGGGDANQALETKKVGDLDGNELNHGNQNTVVCSSASEDSSVQTKVVVEAAMMIDGEDLNTVDGARETISDADVDVKSSDVKTHVTAEDVPHSEAKDSVYSCQSTELVVEGQLDEKVNSNMEIDMQGTDSEQWQMEVNTSSQSTEKHTAGNDQSLKAETVIDRGEEVDLSMGEAMDVVKQVSDAKNVGLDAEGNVKVQEEPVTVETMGVGTENHRNACKYSELLGHQTDLFDGSDEGEASKVNNNVLNQISPSVASDKMLNSLENEDQLAKNAASEDDSSVGQEMEVEEHDTDSEQPTYIDEKTVKLTALKPVSSVMEHQAKYQLLSEEEGEFSVSDLVWGKVRSHPWWPGQIFDPSDASEKAVKYHKKDSFLVAYFGDRTFAWNEASLLKPFRTHFSQIEKQSNSESLQNAINCALEEVSRRVELGLACSCIQQDAYDKIKVQKVENTGVRQESSIREGVDISLRASSFEPDKLVDYMKALAEAPSDGGDQLDLVIAKAQLLAFYRLKGYHQLPEFQFCLGLSENEANTSHSDEKMHFYEVIEHASPMDTDGEQISSGQETSETQRSSYLKRKHNLKDVLYPNKKERSLCELMGETFDSPDDESGSDGRANKLPSPSSGKKKKLSHSFEDSGMLEGRKTISPTKVSLTTPHFPKRSFKIGECIRRAASQMTGSPSILKFSGDRLQKLDGGGENPAADGYDDPFDTLEDTRQKRMNITTEYSSLDELLAQLYLAACDPMKSYSSFNIIIIGFFSDFRDSVVLDQHPGDKAGGKRKKSPNFVIASPETFEFEDMNDTYWTDRIVQNGSEEHPSNGNGRGQYQIIPVELGKPLQKGRKSRKRYSDVNHDLTAQKRPGYVDERAPAELVMNFSVINSVPSETKLNKMFKHFGPLKESETEVDCETSRARVVFRRLSDAEVAYNSAGKFNIFGPVAVNYQLNYTISESFKASLYAPTLAEEIPLIASAHLCGDHALVASSLGEETSLITPSLGEEASFMVSTLGEETLPIATTFHDELSIIASTLGEDTLAIPTTLGDGTSVIVTTMYEETLPIATTMYEETLPIATTAGEGTMAVTTIGDQTFMVTATSGEQSSTIVTTISEQASTVASTLVEEASLFMTTLNNKTSAISTTFGEETSTVNASLGEETSSIATLGQETSTIPTTLGEETPGIPTTLGEETPGFPTTLGKETPTFSMTLAEESPTFPITLGEEIPNLRTSLGEETLVFPATFSEETPSAPPTFSKETPSVPATLGQETQTIPTTIIPETLAEEIPNLCTSLGEETPVIPATFSEETPSAPPTFSNKTHTITATLGQETQTIPTMIIPETLGEETTIVSTTSHEETSAEETPTVTTTLGEETPTNPTTFGEEATTVPTTLGEETTTVPTTLCEETLAEETPTITTTLCEETPTNPTTLGEETPTNPTTLDEESSIIPTALDEETSAVLTTNGEETSTVSTTMETEFDHCSC